jgi:hypothetical protein
MTFTGIRSCTALKGGTFFDKALPKGLCNRCCWWWLPTGISQAYRSVLAPKKTTTFHYYKRLYMFQAVKSWT